VFRRILKVTGGAATLAALMLMVSPASATVVSDDFGTAANYTSMAGANASFTETSNSTVDGNVAVTGSSNILGTVTGTSDVGNAPAAQAATDLVTAIGALAPPSGGTALTSLNTTLSTPGAYTLATSSIVNSNIVLTLNGGASVTPTFFITLTDLGAPPGTGTLALINSTLTINTDSANVRVIFTMGSLGLTNSQILIGPNTTLDNVVFSTGSLTLGSGSVGYGNYLATSSIGVDNKSTICGRGLSEGGTTISNTSSINGGVNNTTCTFARAVPEPASLGMLGGGLAAMAGLGWMAARRKQKAA
jgi:hypothetical protein